MWEKKTLSSSSSSSSWPSPSLSLLLFLLVHRAPWASLYSSATLVVANLLALGNPLLRACPSSPPVCTCIVSSLPCLFVIATPLSDLHQVYSDKVSILHSSRPFPLPLLASALTLLDQVLEPACVSSLSASCPRMTALVLSLSASSLPLQWYPCAPWPGKQDVSWGPSFLAWGPTGFLFL